MKKTINTSIILSFILTIFCCAPKDPNPNIRTEPGIEYCKLACDKMTKLYNEGDIECGFYIEDIEVDGKIMNCIQFCEFEMNNSVQLNPQCIYENINSCTEIPEKCE